MSQPPGDEDDATRISVPAVSGEDAAQATDLVEEIASRYGISDADLDALFNAFVAIYLRKRIVHPDGMAPPCDCPPAAGGSSSYGGGAGPEC